MSGEPYRYRCLDCGSVAVRRTTSSRRPAGKRYPSGGAGVSAARADTDADYYCPKCDQRFHAVEDAITGAPAQPTII
ncbi:hypothetical protein [Halorarius litoreus]|uniref:hypothetical protein n=1 Tax=Halorarius litoreus TaxID=2962676 RepID=UPI0020CE8268|nr:hypothetical protein [Halorarius litoreus]